MGIIGRVWTHIRTKKLEFLEWKKYVWDEPFDIQIPFPKKLYYALRGLTVNEYIKYDLEHRDYREYITNLERLHSREIDGQYKFILDNKMIFEEVFSKYTRVPENYAWINNGTVHGLHENQVNNDNLMEFLCRKESAILKWIDRGGGGGVYRFSWDQGQLYANGEKIDREQLQQIICRDGEAILCEYIKQSDFAASLYPHTTNTMRIVCARRKGEKEVRLIAACQRIGTKESIPVDNVDQGGLFCDIDLETGCLTSCIAQFGKLENRYHRMDTHPQTGVQITGRKIENWEKVSGSILELTRKLPYLNFVAWDVVLTEDGFCVLEGNASSGIGLFQMDEGLRNKEFGEIYKSYGIIQ